MWAIALVLFVTGYSFGPGDAFVAKTTQKVDSPILFPESVQEMNFIDKDKDDPPSCKGQTYCTLKTDDYPEKKFNEMFKGYKAYPQPKLLLDPLQNKQGDPNDKNDCASDVTYEPLYKVREKRDEPWRYVIQAPDHDYVQSVRLEKCVNVDSSCFTMFSPFPGYGTHCRQIYDTWEVLVSKGDNQTELIKAELPVCCSCYYSKNPLILSRLGKTPAE